MANVAMSTDCPCQVASPSWLAYRVGEIVLTSVAPICAATCATVGAYGLAPLALVAAQPPHPASVSAPMPMAAVMGILLIVIVSLVPGG